VAWGRGEAVGGECVAVARAGVVGEQAAARRRNVQQAVASRFA
jgi:hypothetical protein